MGVNLSIKNVPEDLAERLRQRARRNHRSLQGELRAIIEAAAYEASRHLTPAEFLAEIRALRPGSCDESVEIVRQMRDPRYGDEGR